MPVLFTNQLPIKGTEQYWVAYAGVDDVLNGETSGQLLMKLRDEFKSKGVALHSDGGNVLIVSFPAGYSAGDDRIKGFNEATKAAPFNILDTQPAGFDETTGYKIASQMIVANKAKGIDFVYATNDALASGVIQALEEAGFEPGKDVGVVGGTCHGNLKDLESGKEYGTGLQAARLEGVYTIQSIHKYLKNGGTVQDGEFRAPPDPDKAPPAEGPVYKYNFIPNPAVLGSQIDSTKLWGYTMKELCTY